MLSRRIIGGRADGRMEGRNATGGVYYIIMYELGCGGRVWE